MLCVFTYLCLHVCMRVRACVSPCVCVCVSVSVSMSPRVLRLTKEMTLQLECVLHRLETRLSLAIHDTEMHTQAQIPPPSPTNPRTEAEFHFQVEGTLVGIVN